MTIVNGSFLEPEPLVRDRYSKAVRATAIGEPRLFGILQPDISR
jgi:hypothetical protein